MSKPPATHWAAQVVQQAQSSAPSISSAPYTVPPPQPPRPADRQPQAPSVPAEYMQYYQHYYMQAQQSVYQPYSYFASQPSVSSIPAAASSSAVSQNAATSTPSITTTTTTVKHLPQQTYAQIVTSSSQTNKPAQTVTSSAAISSVSKPNPNRFISTPASSTTTTASASLALQNWPSSLKDYVRRNYEICITAEDRSQADQEMKRMINRVAADGRLAVHRWDLEPLLEIGRDATSKETAAAPVKSEAVTINTASVRTEDWSKRYPPSPRSVDSSAGGKKRKSRFDSNYGLAVSKPSSSGWGDASLSVYGPGTATADEKPSKSKKSSLSALDLTAKEISSRSKRSDRFAEEAARSRHKIKQSALTASVSINGNGVDLDSLQVVGTCEIVEKDFFRLTSAPDPSTVRPETVLRAALSLVTAKWEQKNIEYTALCSQLKAIRQDLTVQHIQNEFTVKVYETHARIALQSNDLNEYNQCQTQLKQLYSRGIPGAEMEFTALRILYYVYLNGNRLKGGNADMIYCMAGLSDEAMSDPFVKQALDIRQAIHRENLHSFFKLYINVSYFGKCLLDLNLTSWRLQYLQKLVKAYKPQVEASFILQELALPINEEGIAFLVNCGAVIVDTSVSVLEMCINTKDTVIDANAILTKETNLL